MSHTPHTIPATRFGVLLAHTQSIVGNAVLGVLFALFSYAAFQSWRETGHAQMLLLALQEALMVWLVVTRRRSNEVSRSPWDWTIALLGTAAPLLQRPGVPLHAVVEPLGIAVQVLGALLSVVATASLGRSFGIVAANRGVQTSGLYSQVRHPLYGSYMVGYVGFLLGNASLLNILLIVITVGCQYLRAQAEERVLARDPQYRTYMARVRHRFFPGVF